jgi:hypothetical protein
LRGACVCGFVSELIFRLRVYGNRTTAVQVLSVAASSLRRHTPEMTADARAVTLDKTVHETNGRGVCDSRSARVVYTTGHVVQRPGRSADHSLLQPQPCRGRHRPRHLAGFPGHERRVGTGDRVRRRPERVGRDSVASVAGGWNKSRADRGNTLSGTTFIQRLNTVGGSAPATGCDMPKDIGRKAFVSYTADYFFYKKP